MPPFLIGCFAEAMSVLVARPKRRPKPLEIDAGGFLAKPWVSEVELTVAQKYFFEIGPEPTGAPGRDLANALLSNTRGQFVPGHGFLSAYSFYSLDVEHGRAEIAKLTKVAAH